MDAQAERAHKSRAGALSTRHALNPCTYAQPCSPTHLQDDLKCVPPVDQPLLLERLQAYRSANPVDKTGGLAPQARKGSLCPLNPS